MMINKKSVLILFLLLGLIAVSQVSAEDLSNETLDNYGHDEIGISENIKVNDSYYDDSLQTRDDGTFTALQKKVDDAFEGSTVYLDNDYYYNDDFGSADGIIIDKSLTIEGNGYVIDGQSKSSLFWIRGSNNIVLKNIVFENGFSTGDGAGIYFRGCDGITVKNCNFINNYADDASCAMVRNCTDISFENCYFYNSSARNNAAGLVLMDCRYFHLNNCSFNKLDSWGAGGVIYSQNIYDSRYENCVFNNSQALFGGSLWFERTNATLNNIIFNNSEAWDFGGAITSRYSSINIKNCSFSNYRTYDDGGGAIYNFESDLNVDSSSFIGGSSGYGGAISNLQSNLTILSSKFINNSASHYGGAIYNIYGSIYLNNSFFKDSHSMAGGLIYGMMSGSLTFTNNVFLNSTSSSGSNIYLNANNGQVVESGNHYEDVYHVMMLYYFYCKYFSDPTFSRTLNYVVSSTGKFLNTYETMESDGGGALKVVDMNLSDANYPDNYTIFGNYDDLFAHNFNLTKLFSPGEFEEVFGEDDDFGLMETLQIYYTNDAGNVIDTVDLDVSSFLPISETYVSDFEKYRFLEYNYIHNMGSNNYPASSINSSFSQVTVLPSYYNSNDYGYVTPVKDQYDGGNCWAFSGIATLEAAIKKITNIDYDFSEENAKNLMAWYSDVGLRMNTNKGGYDSMIMGYLTSWLGPVSEGTESYNPYSVLSTVYITNFHVQNIKYLPARKTANDNDIYKKAIMDYGAVSVSLSWAGEGYHAVSLVGWDDNYKGYDSLGTYTTGAWIIKNSWGKDWKNNGFGYLSYYTMFLNDRYDFFQAYTFEFDKNDNYLNNYQYDFAGVSDYLCSDNHIFYSNKFTAADLEDLSAFATYFKYPTEYKASVYLNGKLVLSQSGYAEAGYHTIPLDSLITLEKGDEFIIMVENCNEENYVPVCQAKELNNVNFKANTSFVSYDGINWMDMYYLNGYQEFLYNGFEKDTSQVACLKAFTSRHNSSSQHDVFYYTVNLLVDELGSVNLNEEIGINISISGFYRYYLDIPLIKERTRNSLVTINIDGKDYYAKIRDGKAQLNISFDKAGTHTLTAQYKNNLFESNVVQFNFVVNKANSVLSASSVSKVYGGSESSVITLKDVNGNPISNVAVIVDINGKITTLKTNAKGQAVMPVNLAPNTYNAKITFAGANNYNGASTTAKIVVKKASSKIVASKKTFKAKVKTKKYTITLKDTFGKAIKNAQVTIKIKGKTYKAKTNAKGKATFKVNKLKRVGTFKSTIKFAGNAFYNKASKTVKITVKK